MQSSNGLRAREWTPELRDALREVLCRAAALRLTGFDLAVLSAVVALTASWSKFHDEVQLARIALIVETWPADGTDAQKREATRRVGKALKRLSEQRLIRYAPGSGGRLSQVGIPRPTPGWSDPTNAKLVPNDQLQVGQFSPPGWSDPTSQVGQDGPRQPLPHCSPPGSTGSADTPPASPVDVPAERLAARQALAVNRRRDQ